MTITLMRAISYGKTSSERSLKKILPRIETRSNRVSRAKSGCGGKRTATQGRRLVPSA